jgi:SPP1 gp7 family putative phage head morphogenesis protein
MPSVDVTDDPAEFEEAVRAFRRRVPMPDWKWDALTQAEREFAFKVAGAAQADLATEAWEAMDRAIAEGTTLDAFKKQVGAQLEAAWGRKDPARLETIFRTNALGAYNAGRHEILSHPEVRKARPYLRFDGIDDDRQTEICAALDGTIRPADDPFWHTHSPPLHFQCRSVLVPLSEEEAEEEGIDTKGPDVDADDGFGKPPTVGGDWEPDPKDYPGPIGAQLEEKLQVVEAEPEPPAPPPDYGPSFPRLPRKEAPSLPPVPAPTWSKRTGVDSFIAENNDVFVRATKSLAEMVAAPGAFGSTDHTVSTQLPPGAIGSYLRGRVRLSPKIGKGLKDAIAKGAIQTAEEMDSVRVLVHEQFHGASHPQHDYEASGTTAGAARVAGTVMEEATTELLAQHYSRDYARDALHLKVDVQQRPLFAMAGEVGPELGRPVAYGSWVRGFARLAAFADEGLLDLAPEAFEREVAGRAIQAKALNGRTVRSAGLVSERYGLFMTQVFDRYGIAPGKAADALGMELHDVFADFIQGRAAFAEQRIPDLKAAVDGILEGKAKGSKRRKGPKK